MYSVQTEVIRGIEIADGQFMGSEVIKQRLLSCVFRTLLFNGGGGGTVETTPNAINTFTKLSTEKSNVQTTATKCNYPNCGGEVDTINKASWKR